MLQLLLERKEWDKLIPNRTIYNQKYVFAYFLGKNIEHRRVVTNFAKENGLKVVTLRHLDQYIKNDEKLTTVDKLDLDLDVVMNVMTKICPLCGNKNPDVKICKFCGGHLK